MRKPPMSKKMLAHKKSFSVSSNDEMDTPMANPMMGTAEPDADDAASSAPAFKRGGMMHGHDHMNSHHGEHGHHPLPTESKHGHKPMHHMAHGGMAKEKKMITKAVHEHEEKMHAGRRETKLHLKRGGPVRHHEE